jgi:hypothetical protein
VEVHSSQADVDYLVLCFDAFESRHIVLSHLLLAFTEGYMYSCSIYLMEDEAASTRRVGGLILTRLPMARALTARRLPKYQSKHREAYIIF